MNTMLNEYNDDCSNDINLMVVLVLAAGRERLGPPARDSAGRIGLARHSPPKHPKGELSHGCAAKGACSLQGSRSQHKKWFAQQSMSPRLRSISI